MRRRVFVVALVLSVGVGACEGARFRCDPSPSWSARDDADDGGVADRCEGDFCAVFEARLGPRHSCVTVRRDREVVCFGANEAGQSAPHVELDEVPPTRVDQRIATTISESLGAMALGDLHSCVLYDDATLCWGSERIVGPGGSERPQEMPWRGATMVHAGAVHGCASFASGAEGERRCFGLWNGVDPGAPGDPSVVLEGWVNAMAGFRSAGSRIISGTPRVVLRTWGGVPGPGRFGVGTTFAPGRDLPPVQVFEAVVLGALHGCLMTPVGDLVCWSDGRRGALGTGVLVDDADAPPETPVLLPDGFAPFAVCAGGRVDVALEEAGAVVLGTTGGHTCALSLEGEVLCWGANEHGQIGDGTIEDRPAPVRIEGLPRIDAIACGGAHTCAITDDGELWCWGDNAHGQLGVPSESFEWRATPAPVDIEPAFAAR